MKIIDNDSHYQRFSLSISRVCPQCMSNFSRLRQITALNKASIDKMHLKIVEETEWDAAGELGYVIQAAPNMKILYFNALAWWLALSGSLTDACASSEQKLSVYGHILIYKCHRLTRAFPFLHKGSSWQSVKFKIQIERWADTCTRVKQTEHRERQ